MRKAHSNTEEAASTKAPTKVGACLVYLKSNKGTYVAREEWVSLIQSAS